MQSSHDALRPVYYQIVCDVITLKINALNNEGAPSSLALLPRAPGFFLHPLLSSYYYTDKTADDIPNSSAHKPDMKRDTHVSSDLEQEEINLLLP